MAFPMQKFPAKISSHPPHSEITSPCFHLHTMHPIHIPLLPPPSHARSRRFSPTVRIRSSYPCSLQAVVVVSVSVVASTLEPIALERARSHLVQAGKFQCWKLSRQGEGAAHCGGKDGGGGIRFVLSLRVREMVAELLKEMSEGEEL